MRKFIPLSLSIIILITVSLLWDYIKLPYNNENILVGEYYFKKYNPLNDTIRFLLFILLPSLTYLVSYFFTHKNICNISISSKNYFLNKKESNFYNPLSSYFLLFIILITLEFFSVDLSNFINKVDMYHDGGFLVPPLNYLNNKELYNSTWYDYGLIANNFGTIFNLFFGYYSIGSITLIKLIFIYLTKLFLLLILKEISKELNLDNLLKKVFFIILTFFAISLPNYYDLNVYFSYRQSIYLFFIFILGSTLCNNKNLNFKFFFIGTFSLISVLWWHDIGAYVNALIFLSLIYLLIHREINSFLIIIFGITLSWVLFFLIMSGPEIKEFLYQIKIPYSSAYEYILGMEYRKPFSEESGRWTKALLFIYATSLMIINLNFSKKFYVNYKTKIFTTLLFISGILIFKSALLRSDSLHLKYSSGLYILVFFLILMLFLFQRIDKNKKIKSLLKNISIDTLSKFLFLFYITFAFLFFSGVFNKKDNNTVAKKIQNIVNLKSNVKYLIEAKDDLYLDENTKKVLKFYNKISKDDNCIQMLTDDAAFHYFLRKPSCTQFFYASNIINGYTENKFINQLKLSSPNIILYKSPYNILTNYSNMPNALEHIEKKYSFFENFNNYIFYKKN